MSSTHIANFYIADLQRLQTVCIGHFQSYNIYVFRIFRYHFLLPLSTVIYRINLTKDLLLRQASSITETRHNPQLITRNYCCHAHEMTLSFMYTLIALTYLLSYKFVQ